MKKLNFAVVLLAFACFACGKVGSKIQQDKIKKDAIGGPSSEAFLSLPFNRKDCRGLGDLCISSKVDTPKNTREKTTYKNHKGTDYRLNVGSSVYAAASGMAYCRFHGSSIERLSANGLGIYIEIVHGNGFVTRYAHLREYSIECKNDGVYVGRGCLIAKSGKTGCPWGPNGDFGCGAHLHFEVKKNGVALDPYDANSFLWLDSEPKKMSCNSLPKFATDSITRRMTQLGRDLTRTMSNVHWYLGHEGKVAILDIMFQKCSAAIVFDHAGGAQRAYLVKCGMWHYWSSKGGPGSILGMPIGEEYGHQVSENGRTFTRIYQDFQNARLVWESDNPHSPYVKYYKYATPGKVKPKNRDDSGWRGKMSYRFAERYAEHRGILKIGEADQPHSNTLDDVHVWHGLNGYKNYVQDFVGPEWNWTVIMYNDRKQEAFLIRSGFWQKYRTLGLIKTLGQPQNDEYLVRANYPMQNFEGGYMQFKDGVFSACLKNGMPACSKCGQCDKGGFGGPGGQTNKDICKPGQYVCDNASTQKQCDKGGKSWTIKKCAHGCKGHRCNICKPKSTWCHNSITMQRCNQDGKSFTDVKCQNGCKNGICDVKVAEPPRKKICTPEQIQCKNSSVQQKCSDDGMRWIELSCKYGCSNDNCKPKPTPQRVCTPSEKRCNGSTRQTCKSDGMEWVRSGCTYGCTNGSCNICSPSKLRCNNQNIEKCTSNGTKWQYIKRCNARCSHGKCESPPMGKACVSNTRRCVNGREVQQCQSDGARWIYQFSCKNNCGQSTPTCKTAPSCTISYSKTTKTVQITGIHSVAYFTTSCVDMRKSTCWHKHHKTQGTRVKLPQGQDRVHPRDKNDNWIYSTRSCKQNNMQWIEDPKGGYFRIR